MKPRRVKLVDVLVHSGRGDLSLHEGVDKAHLQMIKQDIKRRNKFLRWADYPQRWSYEVIKVKGE